MSPVATRTAVVCLYCRRVFPGDPEHPFCSEKHERLWLKNGEKRLPSGRHPRQAPPHRERVRRILDGIAARGTECPEVTPVVSALVTLRRAGKRPPVVRERVRKVVAAEKPKREPKPREPRAKPAPQKRVCARCGREFEAKTSRAKYCKPSCRCRRVTVICEQCGREFEAFESDVKRGHAKHCGRECRHAANSVDLVCPVCGTEFNRPKSQVRTVGPPPCCCRRCSNMARKMRQTA